MSECNWPTCGCQNVHGAPWCKAHTTSTMAEPPPALAALAMRERAAKELDSDVAFLKADASRFRQGTDPHHGRMAFAEAAKRQAERIRAIPITFTDAELLAAAMHLPEVRALVEAAERAKTSVENGGGGGVIDVVWLDGPTNETMCDHLAVAIEPFRK